MLTKKDVIASKVRRVCFMVAMVFLAGRKGIHSSLAIKEPIQI